ncbi:hypothetical protein AB837_00310 [bacterium AB1]|nr:hypothetical protein AB837_00310 [bacterium AB1]
MFYLYLFYDLYKQLLQKSLKTLYGNVLYISIVLFLFSFKEFIGSSIVMCLVSYLVYNYIVYHLNTKFVK